MDTTDGVRVIEPDGGWILVLPDPSDAVTHLWAEGWDSDGTRRRCWTSGRRVVEQRRALNQIPARR